MRTIGTKSNRSGIGSRIKCVTRIPGVDRPVEQVDEVRSGGSYFSQNDLRVHFGLGKASKVDVLQIRWPSGHVDELKDLDVDRVVHVKERTGIVKVDVFKKH